ncbi:hypothetical protein [Pseudoroseomonas ludipueritiae]|uniref:Uncharacterized protein n=1 Tax=Pseudoroseomonas ludipueritiae TaxID=198093 RepID=A0ABR7RDR5_9PROT|nr:hypothetical protein [Pseudoroseomonas ludipueritiae]MBC9180009.1 hypothetical protein [Pseudoroseomonas ludipueritiae]
MMRIPLAFAAATLAATLGGNLAQAQSSPAYPTPSVPSATGQPVPVAPGGSYGGMHQRGMSGQTGMAPGSRMGSGMGSTMGSGMGSGMAGTTMTPQGPMVQTPSQPFTGLSLPQQGVGDGAYNGGGVVLEYLPDGTRRVVQQ